MSNKEFLKRLGMELKVARIRKGMSRVDVVKLTGVNPNTISLIELGKNDAKILTLKRMIDALGMDMKDFL